MSLGRTGSLIALLALLALLAGMCASAAAQPVNYRLNPAHSFVHFEVMHFRTSTMRGRFGPLQGMVTLDRNAGRGEVGVTIDTTKLKREVCGGDFEGVVMRSEFGMTFGLPFIADRVRLVLQVEGIRE